MPKPIVSFNRVSNETEINNLSRLDKNLSYSILSGVNNSGFVKFTTREKINTDVVTVGLKCRIIGSDRAVYDGFNYTVISNPTNYEIVLSTVYSEVTSQGGIIAFGTSTDLNL